MWPFTKNETEEVKKQLPENLQGFFEEQTPAEKASIFEITPQQQRVNAVLKKPREYDYNFDRYKQSEKARKVASINCAELQEKVVQCFRGYSFTSGNQCKEEIANVSKCIQVQGQALKKLHYDDCVDIPQCDSIRYIVDKFFTDNFGQFGDMLGEEERHTKFNSDVDGVFFKIWKK